jgi:hypothetical protein
VKFAVQVTVSFIVLDNVSSDELFGRLWAK